MSFQDVQSSRHRTEATTTTPNSNVASPPRMRRNHPPKLPRVKALLPFTQPPTTTKSKYVNRGRSVEPRITNNSRRNITGNDDYNDNMTTKVLDDDMIESYELKLSNSNSSCSESSILDTYTESRDDYESFGPDRSYHHHRHRSNGTTGSATRKDFLPEQQHQQYSTTASPPRKSHHRQRSKSTFAKLSYEMQQYQKLVSDLEYMIRDTNFISPEIAWRTNILVKSVEDTDDGISTKLQQYEQLLRQQERLLTYNTNTKRDHHNDRKQMSQQHAACSKLRRDYNRCHNSMTTSLQTYTVRQKADVSQLGAVQWNNVVTNRTTASSSLLQQQQQIDPQTEEDFFDRVMRQKEMERLNDSMRQVNDIYHGLAGLVNGQQEDIDQLSDGINYSNANIKSGYNEFSCYADRQNGFVGTLCGDMNEWGQTEDIHSSNNDITTTRRNGVDGPSSITQEGLRINENFYLAMPFETMKDDWQSVWNDLVELGSRFVMHCKRLECCNDE